jgi:hypothetical protein
MVTAPATADASWRPAICADSHFPQIRAVAAWHDARCVRRLVQPTTTQPTCAPDVVPASPKLRARYQRREPEKTVLWQVIRAARRHPARAHECAAMAQVLRP